MGGTFKSNHLDFRQIETPVFTIKDCAGIGDPTLCAATKNHQRLDRRTWRTKCYICKRKWTA